MAKEKGASRATRGDGTLPTLAELRSQIDRIDRELVRLANERATLAIQIGKVKDQTGSAAYDPAREEEVLSRAVAAGKGPLPAACLRAVFRELISGSRSLETRLRVAYLGPEYTYSHLAAIHRFGQSAELVPVGTIAAVFEEVHGGQSHFGIVPLENSTDGRVADTLDMFTRLTVRVCGEVQLRIRHHLLGKCARGDVREVFSRPQALSQCRNWLAKHLPQARLVEVTSTSAAAQMAQEKAGAAAIASRQAGMHYGLTVLAGEIEDQAANVTRFAVIGAEAAARSGHDKSVLMFEVEHRPGALADAMVVFKRQRLNMTWIESFPIARPEGGYMFFVELDGHAEEVRVRRAIGLLQRKTLRLEVLGSCPRTEVVD